MTKSKQIKYRRTKAYLVQLSKGDPVKIDEDELQKVLQALQSGSPVVLRQGVVNPSYVTSVVQDRDRVRAWLEECKYGHGQGDAIRANGIKALPDIMNTTELAKRLGTGDTKALNKG